MNGPAAGWSRDLAAEVASRLDLLDQVAAGLADPTVDPDAMRAELAQLAAAWRHLLVLHQPDDERRGRCPRCRTWRGHRRWPCAVWRSAHEALVARNDLAPRPASTISTPAVAPTAPILLVPPAAAAATSWETSPSLASPPRVRVSIPPQSPVSPAGIPACQPPGRAASGSPGAARFAPRAAPGPDLTDGGEDRPYGRHAWAGDPR